MTPSVSVLMAVHNGRPTLAESMDSVLGQSWGDFEFVIVDDGSTDGSTEMLQDYANRDARIRLLRNDARRNLPTSLNLGLRACRAPWQATPLACGGMAECAPFHISITWWGS